VNVLEIHAAGAGLRLHVALAGLLGVDVARAGVDREAAVQSGGVNAARAGGEFGVVADSLVVDVAGAGAGVEKSVGWGFDHIFNADVVVVFVMRADADDIAGLLDGGLAAISRTFSSLPPQFDRTLPITCTWLSEPWSGEWNPSRC